MRQGHQGGEKRKKFALTVSRWTISNKAGQRTSMRDQTDRHIGVKNAFRDKVLKRVVLRERPEVKVRDVDKIQGGIRVERQDKAAIWEVVFWISPDNKVKAAIEVGIRARRGASVLYKEPTERNGSAGWRWLRRVLTWGVFKSDRLNISAMWWLWSCVLIY